MSLGRLPSPSDPDALTVIARDAEGRAQGYLHLVPCWGDEPGFSLDQMRRRPDTPNGLTEWMIAETMLQLGGRGVSRFSLNFAVRGRLFDERVKLGEIGYRLPGPHPDSGMIAAVSGTAPYIE